MPPKTQVLFKEEALEKVLEGIETLYEAVSMTLGPRSLAVGMDSDFAWKLNKDGVSVARSINLKDPYQNFGVKVVRESAQKTVDQVGDGTTTTIILAQALIHEALKVIHSGVSPMALRQPLEEGVDNLIKELDKLAVPVKTYEEKLNIATISANGDTELGKLIADTIEKVGNEGVITIEESKDLETRAEIQEGMQLDHGYSHPLLINNPEKMSAIYEDVPILVTSKSLHDIAEVGKFLTEVVKHTNQLVIITPDVAMDIMEVLVRSKLTAGGLQTLVIKAPSQGENQREILRDICALTGATFITPEAGHKFDQLTKEHLGTLTRVVANKNATILTNTNANKAEVGKRIAGIKAQMAQDDLSDFEKEKLKERLGKLTNGIAVLKIGGATKIEMEERRERAEDSVGCLKAAIKGGILPGGEVTYLKIREVLEKDLVQGILFKALEAPFRKLLTNAGFDPSIELAEMNHKVTIDNAGFDVTTGQVVDMLKQGVIDPKLVLVSALQNSLSVAMAIISLGCVITPIPNEKD